MKLSLCIAVYNEEKNIHYPLDSAYDLADEVIIVDGGSTDRTVEIARSYGKKVKVFIEDNSLMFHINKQKAIDRASGEWILQLDADEMLSEELKNEIKNLIHQFKNQKSDRTSEVKEERSDGKTSEVNEVVAYWLPRKNFFLSRFLMKGGQYPDHTIRLYRNGYARFPCKNVHENVEIISSLKSKSQKQKIEFLTSGRTSEVKGEQSDSKTSEVNKIGYLKNPILHYADPNFSRYIMRWNRYNNLDAELLIKRLKLNACLPARQVERLNWLTLFISYIFIKPTITFFSMYFRHLGFLDGLPGFIFAFFSSIRFWAIYIKAVAKCNS